MQIQGNFDNGLNKSLKLKKKYFVILIYKTNKYFGQVCITSLFALLQTDTLLPSYCEKKDYGLMVYCRSLTIRYL